MKKITAADLLWDEKDHVCTLDPAMGFKIEFHKEKDLDDSWISWTIINFYHPWFTKTSCIVIDKFIESAVYRVLFSCTNPLSRALKMFLCHSISVDYDPSKLCYTLRQEQVEHFLTELYEELTDNHGISLNKYIRTV